MAHVLKDLSTLSCENTDFHVLCDLWALSSSLVLFSFLFHLPSPASVVSSPTCRNQYSAKYPENPLCSSLEHSCEIPSSLTFIPL